MSPHPSENPLTRVLAALEATTAERVAEIEEQLLDNLIYGTPLPAERPVDKINMGGLGDHTREGPLGPQRGAEGRERASGDPG